MSQRRYADRWLRLPGELAARLVGFLWIADLTFVRAEGVAMGPEAREGHRVRERRASTLAPDAQGAVT